MLFACLDLDASRVCSRAEGDVKPAKAARSVMRCSPRASDSRASSRRPTAAAIDGSARLTFDPPSMPPPRPSQTQRNVFVGRADTLADATRAASANWSPSPAIPAYTRRASSRRGSGSGDWRSEADRPRTVRSPASPSTAFLRGRGPGDLARKLVELAESRVCRYTYPLCASI